MYKVVYKKTKHKKKVVIDVDGFLMQSKTKCFKINGTEITNIIIINKKLAHPFASKITMKKYNKLIILLTEYLSSDDDSGEALRQALNMIEKFRQEVKNKYRKFLKRKELEEMSTKLKFLEKEASIKKEELINSYKNSYISNRSK